MTKAGQDELDKDDKVALSFASEGLGVRVEDMLSSRTHGRMGWTRATNLVSGCLGWI